jgi:hypothetical protein
MGGDGSGQWVRWSKKDTTAESLPLDRAIVESCG